MILDCTHIPTGPSNTAMEYLCKSVEEHGLFHPHPTDRLMAAMEDASTWWVTHALQGIKVLAIQAFGLGDADSLRGLLKKADPEHVGPKCRQLERKLATTEPGTLSLPEYLDVLDCWLWKYLPPAVSTAHAHRQAMQQYLAGWARQVETPKSADQARAIVEALPTTVGEASPQYPLTSLDRARIQVAQASAARYVQRLTAQTRAALQDVIINAERRRIAHAHDRYDLRPLEQQLRDSFGDLNRDWRRIAVTETAINANDAYLSRFQPGAQVKWLIHPGACVYCESQKNKVFTVVAPDHPRKDPYTMVWVGKFAENVGRALAKRKRLESGELTDRSLDELVVPVIPAHPGCRCLYVPA